MVDRSTKRATPRSNAPLLIMCGLGAVLLLLGGALFAAAVVAGLWFDLGGDKKNRHDPFDHVADQLDPKDDASRGRLDPKDKNKIVILKDNGAKKDQADPKDKDARQDKVDPKDKDKKTVGPKEQPDFVPLFNGKDLTGWKTHLKTGGADDGRVFSVRDAVLVISGQPHGYVYTEASYRNYLIRLDWRYERPKGLVDDRKFNGDGGLLMHIVGEPKVWPDSIQVQWYFEHYGLIYLVPHIQGKNYVWNQSAVGQAMRRVGEWNRTEVLAQDGRITCTLNGVEVGVGNGNRFAGQIGLQSEGAALQFKRIDIKPLP